MTNPKISVENVVVSATIPDEINLKEINEKFEYADYNPGQFPGLIFRIENPRTTTLIFRTGKFICTGSKSEKDANLAIRNVIKYLRNHDIKISEDVKTVVQNIVGSADIKSRIHIEQAAVSLPRSMYEPEQFPGLIYRNLNPKTVLLLFASGKIVCTGAKSVPDIHKSVNQVKSFLTEKNLLLD